MDTNVLTLRGIVKLGKAGKEENCLLYC